MKKTTAFLTVIAFFAACSAVYAEYITANEGRWPESWPKELEPLRDQATTWVGPEPPRIHYLIPFTKRADFESAWPHLLKVKTKGAPVILLRAPKTDYMGLKPAGVLIHSPPAGTDTRTHPEKPIENWEQFGDVRVRWMWTTYIELVVDGRIVNLNRIPLPADTPIIDQRSFDNKDDKAPDRGPKITPPAAPSQKTADQQPVKKAPAAPKAVKPGSSKRDEPARPQTWTLKLKKANGQSRNAGFSSSSAGLDLGYLYGAASRQSLYIRVAKDGKPIATSQGGRTSDFDRIVKKEPRYQCAWPLRGVFRLGSQKYAFALDMVSPPTENPKTEEKPKSDPLTVKPGERPSNSKPPAPKPMAYNRLHFDLNHNGDLTDDKAIETKLWPSYVVERSKDGSVSVIQAPFEVPQIDLQIDADGTKMDYAFSLLGYSNTSRDGCNAWISLSSAAYREGEITLEGKKHRVALIDFNSNGRFDDETTLSPGPSPDREIHQRYGDVLFLDPEKFPPATASLHDWASNRVQHPVGKFLSIDGRLYDMQVSPSGDKLTLMPSSAPAGNVTNPNGSFSALVYGDKGWLKISATDDAPAVLPEGQWKLYGYTLECAEQLEPLPPDEDDEPPQQTPGKQPSSIHGAEAKPDAQKTNPPPSIGPMWTLTAQAMIDYKPVTVRSGQTVVMPFGPPYTPTVSGSNLENSKDGKRLSLGVRLVGSVGEVCTSTTVDGRRAPRPRFTITDPKGKIVQEGRFEYG
ncbi:MAG TPA: hypothetical protein DD670_09320 [Planctomycetaceae bacterium]|nr:hypothetical protein [Planctomycetaceae bacterium]